MTGCKMVEKSPIAECDLHKSQYAALVGTKHLASVILATKGAIVVTLQIKELLYKGVLLQLADSSAG